MTPVEVTCPPTMLHELPWLSKNEVEDGGTIVTLGHCEATGLVTPEGNWVNFQDDPLAYQIPQVLFC